MSASSATPDAPLAGAPAVSVHLPLSLCIGWGIGTLSMSLMFQSVSLFALKYLVDHVGVAAATAGLVIGLTKIYDALIDPTVGTISDRTRSRWGRRRPYLLVGAILSALSFVLIFNLAGLRGSEYVLYAIIGALLLQATGYSLFNIPYLSMPPEITGDYHERTRLISFRAASVAMGGLAAGALGPVLIGQFGGGERGYAAMAWILGFVILGVGVACFWMTRTAPAVREITQSVAPFAEQFRTALGNRPFMLLLVVKVTHLGGLAMSLATMPFLFTTVLGYSYEALGLYFLVQNSFVLLSQPFWVRYVRWLGKNQGYYLAALFYGTAYLSWLLATPGGSMLEVALRAAATGIGAGGVLLIGQAMLPDTMQYDYQRTGLRREGVFAGVYTTVEGMSFALGPALVGALLGAAGYVTGAGGADIQQPEAAISVIYLCASVFPCVGIALAALTMKFYRLDETQLRRGTA